MTPNPPVTMPQVRLQPASPGSDISRSSSTSSGTTNHINNAISSAVKQCLDISGLSHASSIGANALTRSTSQPLPGEPNVTSHPRQPSVAAATGPCSTCASSADVSNVRVYSNTHPNCLAHTNSRGASQPMHNTGQHRGAPNGHVNPNPVPAHRINETFRLDTIMEGVSLLGNSPVTHVPLKSESGQGDSLTAPGTVTKTKPSVSSLPTVEENGTAPMQQLNPSMVNSGTVTKSKPATSIDSRAGDSQLTDAIRAAGQTDRTAEAEQKPSIVKSFNFQSPGVSRK